MIRNDAKIEGTDLPATNRDYRLRKNAERLDEMRKNWRTLHERLRAAMSANPDLQNRDAAASMVMDLTMGSTKEAVILKSLSLLVKMYGHDVKTIVSEDAGSRETRLNKWREELPRLGLEEFITVDAKVIAKIDAKSEDPDKEFEREFAREERLTRLVAVEEPGIQVPDPNDGAMKGLVNGRIVKDR